MDPTADEIANAVSLIEELPAKLQDQRAVIAAGLHKAMKEGNTEMAAKLANTLDVCDRVLVTLWHGPKS